MKKIWKKIKIMKSNEEEHNISIFGEFTDKGLEMEFFNYYSEGAMHYIRPLMLVFGLLNMLFIIPDYFIAKNTGDFMAILASRTIFLLLIIILFIATKKVKNYIYISYWITIYEVIAFATFLFIFYQYENRNFTIQAFGVMIMILAFFLIPNKLINSLVVSSLISITFFVFASYHIKNIESMEYSACIAYILIVLVICSISSFKNNYYNRKQYEYSKELLELSTIDRLTGIYNKGKFNEELEKWIAYSKRYKVPCSLVMLDFDNFKKVNDTYGHLVGDKVLIDTANIIKNSMRQTDVFARWGGEEFVLLFPNTDRQGSIEFIERLKYTICHNKFEKAENITCSFGLVMFNENDTADTLMNRADKLLYEAKEAGKNSVVVDEFYCKEPVLQKNALSF